MTGRKPSDVQEPAHNFDFNGDIPLAAEAAKAMTEAHLLRMFEELHAANLLWSDPARGPQSAAIAALEAVVTFLYANNLNAGGKFSRPLELLCTELRTAPASIFPAILPPLERGQSPDLNRRKAVNYIKAAATYTANRLHADDVKLEAACSEVAGILKTYDFTVGGGRKKSEPADAIKAWRAAYPKGHGPAAKFFQHFCATPPVPSHMHPIDWLKGELEHTGYTEHRP